MNAIQAVLMSFDTQRDEVLKLAQRLASEQRLAAAKFVGMRPARSTGHLRIPSDFSGWHTTLVGRPAKSYPTQ